jgi:hypothetical protein
LIEQIVQTISQVWIWRAVVLKSQKLTIFRTSSRQQEEEFPAKAQLASEEPSQTSKVTAMPTRPLREVGSRIPGSLLHHDGVQDAKAPAGFCQDQAQVSVLGENLRESADLVENTFSDEQTLAAQREPLGVSQEQRQVFPVPENRIDREEMAQNRGPFRKTADCMTS